MSHSSRVFPCRFLFKSGLPVWTFLFLILFIQSLKAEHGYSNEWAVEIEGGDNMADLVADTHGFINHGKILQHGNFYLFAHPRLKKRSLSHSSEHHKKLISHEKVQWAEQQRIKRRVKRDLLDPYDPEHSPNDPKWSDMWYLLSTTQPSMRVEEAWQAGFTGKDVSVTILDDGIERLHSDLKDNYDPLASGDINNHDDDPTPRLNPSNENRHGTRCAGEVAAVANNGICSIGIAYNGKIGGVRMLDGQVTDAVEAASIGFNPDHVDIYSASWGPDDDGRTVDGPAKLARKAFVDGVTRGRNGKGSIFVWASGNGGRRADNCNCDGYTDSIYTLSISSTTQRKTKPWYSESCSSTLATTYSSGDSMDKQIVTTDLRHGCTMTHTGTSASAPLAAGVCALALEANPSLTWRDMQHLVVQTARPDGLQADDWVVNGVNRKVSHAYGYGLMDAYGMVTRAKNWTLVPPQRICTKSVISDSQTPRILSSGGREIIPVEVVACDDGGEALDRLEHVQAELTIQTERRGDLEIYLTSPSGTKSQLLGFRRSDITSQGFTKWAFMTTHCWDEKASGRWLLEIYDRNIRAGSGKYYRPYFGPTKKPPKPRTLSHYNLIMYGTRNSDWPAVQQHRSTSTAKASVSPAIKPSPSAPPHHQVIISKSPKTTPISPVAHFEGAENCQVALASGKGCLACKKPFFLNVTSHLCLSTCTSGHYHASERVNKEEEVKVTAPRRKTAEFEFEVEEEEIFEDEERFYNALVCRPCAPHCHSCSGPLVSQCVQCVSGSVRNKNDSSCSLSTTVSLLPAVKNSNVLSITAIFVLILSAMLFLYLCRTHSKSCFKSSRVSYKYLPSGEGSISRLADEYHDDPDDADPLDPHLPIHTDPLDPKFDRPLNGYRNGNISMTTSKLITSDQSALLD